MFYSDDAAEKEREKLNRVQENLLSSEERWNVFIKVRNTHTVLAPPICPTHPIVQCCKAMHRIGQNDRLKQLILCAHVAKKFELHEKVKSLHSNIHRRTQFSFTGAHYIFSSDAISSSRASLSFYSSTENLS